MSQIYIYFFLSFHMVFVNLPPHILSPLCSYSSYFSLKLTSWLTYIAFGTGYKQHSRVRNQPSRKKTLQFLLRVQKSSQVLYEINGFKKHSLVFFLSLFLSFFLCRNKLVFSVQETAQSFYLSFLSLIVVIKPLTPGRLMHKCPVCLDFYLFILFWRR